MVEYVRVSDNGIGFKSVPSSGVSAIGINLYADGVPAVLGDGVAFVPPLPSPYAGKALSRVQLSSTGGGAGTGSTIVQVHNLDSAVDMLTTGASILPGSSIGNVGVVDQTNASVGVDTRLRIDIRQLSSPPPTGLSVVLEFN